MSTELKKLEEHPFYLTRYWGGAEKGESLQVTGPNCDGTGYIGMTREEALGLSVDLMRFALHMEVDVDELEKFGERR